MLLNLLYNLYGGMMFSIAFPNIFNGSKVNLYKDYDAIKSNLTALLSSDKGALFGDPFYGTRLKTLLWSQAYDPMVRDLIKDDIFEAIYSYMPQITVYRNDISVSIQNNVVTASIRVRSDSGVESNLFDIDLLTGTENN